MTYNAAMDDQKGKANAQLSEQMADKMWDHAARRVEQMDEPEAILYASDFVTELNQRFAGQLHISATGVLTVSEPNL